MALTPKEIIKEQLDEYMRNKDKSDKSYEQGQIPASTHDMHMDNLTPIIEQFRYALQILNKYT